MAAVDPPSETQLNPESGTRHSILLLVVAGIPIRMHLSLLVLLAFFVFSGSGPGRWHGLLYILGIFGCVALHELGHSLVARKYGIEVSEIVLYPIGGVARMVKLPKPKQEFWIALAGPAVNIVLAIALFLLIRSQTGTIDLDHIDMEGKHWWHLLFGANVFLAIFNLVPAFPMDGGRVLRSVLAMRMDELKATQIAAAVGQFLAFAIGLIGLLSHNYILVFIAFFVYIGAGQEALLYKSKALVEGVSVLEAMITDFKTLPVGATLGEAREMLLRTSQTEFPINHGDEIVGLLSRNALLHGLAEHGPGGYVAGSMNREYPTIHPAGQLEEIAPEMQSGRTGCVLVMDNGALVGIVTKENLAELLIVRQIMERKEGPRPR